MLYQNSWQPHCIYYHELRICVCGVLLPNENLHVYPKTPQPSSKIHPSQLQVYPCLENKIKAKKEEEEEKISNPQGHPVQEAGASFKREEEEEKSLAVSAHKYPEAAGNLMMHAIRIETPRRWTAWSRRLSSELHTRGVIKPYTGWTISSLKAFITLICKRGHQQRVPCRRLPLILQGYVGRNRNCTEEGSASNINTISPPSYGDMWEEIEIVLKKEVSQIWTPLNQTILHFLGDVTLYALLIENTMFFQAAQ
jgi:hypothetical protein